MTVEFESGRAHLEAVPGAGFDPLKIPAALRDAGFGSAEIELVASGAWAEHDGMPALSMAGPIVVLVLAGGDALAELRSSGPATGARLRIEGRLHSSHGDRPPGMTVEAWSALPESSDQH